MARSGLFPRVTRSDDLNATVVVGVGPPATGNQAT
jgi:hypothetical protein